LRNVDHLETFGPLAGCPEAMEFFRFVTPHRKGKWYADLAQAQQRANDIGAGFLDRVSGKFVAYRETRLERRNRS
jgi:hypothetical protein